MKKILLIFLSIFYLTSISGITLNFHYCGGKLKTVSFYETDSEKGCCGKKMKSNKCCGEKTTYIKVKDNHNYTGDVKIPSGGFKIIDVALKENNIRFTTLFNSHIIPDCHAPPILDDNPLYLKNRVFLI